MFNGTTDQLHQFIASSRNISLFHGSNHQVFPPGFDPYRSSELHHQSQPFISKIDDTEDRSVEPWSNDEVLLLLKLRSNMDNWFPNNFSWEHVSRKLEELGIKRSAEECKEKFEQESNQHHHHSVSYSKNYRILSELDELYRPGGNQEERVGTNQEMVKEKEEDRDEKTRSDEHSRDVREMSSEDVVEKSVKPIKKRKRRGEKFERLKSYCEAIVNKMMAQQEEMHNKLIEDIIKRDEEIIAREEEWKTKEMDRTKLELEKMAKEQAKIGERHAIILEFLKKFTSEKALTNPKPNSPTEATPPTRNSPLATHDSTESILPNNDPLLTQPPQSNIESTGKIEATRDKLETTPQNPSPSHQTPPQTTIPIAKDSNQDSSSGPIIPFGSDTDRKGDLGMRWPRDQVLALINMRCKFNNATNNNDESTKGPLWERISQAMMELGYKRSAKRCKEKWENINKYFRKTKDSNKKRSVESRTCPYFHQLSRLYSDGTLVAPLNEPENQLRAE